ncbi:hypothetical protein [Rhodoferax sp.]|uniref:hypothetical protein n=1 Tax=Rhodoferax sp. TaxID=50421 RepID=UPI0025D4157B|nr:hypothetical protein [Rhodoferax sp.]MCM2297136.1 hypothetical protein [Rhodoferax sp.]
MATGEIELQLDAVDCSRKLNFNFQAAPTLAKRRQISQHIVRNTTAMHMLQSGTPIEELALWMGYESRATRHHYVEANLAMEESAIARMQEPDSKIRRYHAPDELLKNRNPIVSSSEIQAR